MFPTGMLKIDTQSKILRVLAEKNNQYMIDELSEMCYRTHSNVSTALKNL